MPEPNLIRVNGEDVDITRYLTFHRQRFQQSIAALRKHASGTVAEVGGHPWAMTALIAATPGFQLSATVSAEEITKWPDDIGVAKHLQRLEVPDVWSGTFANYSLNIERTLADLDEPVDAVFACEVIEHLVRAPHVMLLNINRWLKPGGFVLVTTPNGMQFSNPFRRRSGRPAYRCYCYERHNGALTLGQLEDLTSRAGFEIVESGYWNVYERQGWSRAYAWAARIPWPYFQAKFLRTIYVIAKKAEHRQTLQGLPRAYAPHADWEYIDAAATPGN